MSILHIHRNQVLYLERARIYVFEDRVCYAQTQDGVNKTWNIPSLNLSCLILGTGCSISTAATFILSKSMVYVMHSGTGGSPVFTTSLIDYRPTKILQKWILFWPHEQARLAVAKFLARERCFRMLNIEQNLPQYEIIKKSDMLIHIEKFLNNIEEARDIQQLSGFEGDFAKKLYYSLTSVYNIPWFGRNNSQKRDSKDVINKMIDDGNYIIYGFSGLAIFLMGLVPQLPVTHGKTRAGGLVFDIADVFKDSISLTCACQSYHENISLGSQFRSNVVSWCDQNKLLNKNIEIIYEATDIGFNTIHGDETLLMLDDSYYNELNQELDHIHKLVIENK